VTEEEVSKMMAVHTPKLLAVLKGLPARPFFFIHRLPAGLFALNKKTV
jgi:hypothetical protein